MSCIHTNATRSCQYVKGYTFITTSRSRCIAILYIQSTKGVYRYIVLSQIMRIYYSVSQVLLFLSQVRAHSKTFHLRSLHDKIIIISNFKIIIELHDPHFRDLLRSIVAGNKSGERSC